MSSDITRNSFDPARAFTRVVRQQGRMHLDADFNEQSDILLHLHRSLARDLFGDYFVIDNAFQISKIPGSPNDLAITPGVCYIDGIRVEARGASAQLQYFTQPFPDTARDASWEDADYVAFLDVWERDVTGVDDSTLLEPALMGADTSTRTQVLWQVKVRKIPANSASFSSTTYDQGGEAGKAWQQIIRNELAPGSVDSSLPDALMTAVTMANADDSNAGQPATSNYIRDTNQLYRIEIHTGGDATTATFKWSRDNASVMYAATPTNQKQQVKLVSNYAEATRAFRANDFAQIICSSNPGQFFSQLYQVRQISADGLTITLDADLPPAAANAFTIVKWDGGPIPVSTSKWQQIEQGIYIRFDPNCCFRSGEYWLVPARADTCDIIWPKKNGSSVSVPSTGGRHHYAPLAVVKRLAGAFAVITPTRRKLARTAFVQAD